MMNWKGCERKRSQHNLRYYPGIYLEGLMKITKTKSGQPVSGPSYDAENMVTLKV
jgi:hypothetical protein